ncbi:MAG: hypothetical protein QOF25_5627 [Mycobacterium sp.]|jgi:hypothetical protein|nr:hypothetical protein [Mycobacterium sp.]
MCPSPDAITYGRKALVPPPRCPPPVGPRADQAQRGRLGDPAIPQGHRERQRESAAGRIAGNDRAFRVEPLFEQSRVHGDHLFEGDRISSFRCPGVFGDERRHAGRRGQVRDHTTVALGAPQRVGAAVQVDQGSVGITPRCAHPLDGNTGDGDAVEAGALRRAPGGTRECVEECALAVDRNALGCEQWSRGSQPGPDDVSVDSHDDLSRTS